MLEATHEPTGPPTGAAKIIQPKGCILRAHVYNTDMNNNKTNEAGYENAPACQMLATS